MSRLSLLFVFLVGCMPSVSGTRGKLTEVLNPVGVFSLTERSGKTVTNTDLEGKVWIGSFVFTRCTESCPQVTGTVARLQKEFAEEPNIRFITFTVDPERDDPEELKKYAEIYRADPERWLFLTGKEETIKQLLREQFHVDAIHNPNAKTPGQEFDHSSKLVLVDRNGNLRNYFDGMRRTKVSDPEKEFEESFKAMKRKIQEVLSE